MIYRDGITHVASLIYVDNMILVGNNMNWIERTKSHLDREFSIKDLGPLKYFLGIKVARTSEGLVLSQKNTHWIFYKIVGYRDADLVPFPWNQTSNLTKPKKKKRLTQANIEDS